MFNTEYYHCPRREIDQTIHWLRGVMADCDAKISRLENLKNQDERIRRHKSKMNDLADLFDEPDFFNLDEKHQLMIIQQRLGVAGKQSQVVYEILARRKKQRDIKRRNYEIMELYIIKKPVTHIAKKTGVSRQTVHAVLKELKQEQII